MLLKRGLLSNISGGGTKYVVISTEIPVGAKDGINKTYSYSYIAVAETLLVFYNGQSLTENIDYTYSGNQFTLLTVAPISTTNLLVQYGYRNSTPVAPTSSEIEIPIGIKDGVNTDFTLTYAPLAETLLVFKNGQTLTENIDYTFSGITIIFLIAPIETDNLLTKYNY